MKKILFLLFLICFSLSVFSADYGWDSTSSQTVITNFSAGESFRIIESAEKYSPYWIKILSVTSDKVEFSLGFEKSLENHLSAGEDFDEFFECGSVGRMAVSKGNPQSCLSDNLNRNQILVYLSEESEKLFLKISYQEAEEDKKISQFFNELRPLFDSLQYMVESKGSGDKLEGLPVYVYFDKIERKFKIAFIPVFSFKSSAYDNEGKVSFELNELNVDDSLGDIIENKNIPYDSDYVLTFSAGIFDEIKNPVLFFASESVESDSVFTYVTPEVQQSYKQFFPDSSVPADVTNVVPTPQYVSQIIPDTLFNSAGSSLGNVGFQTDYSKLQAPPLPQLPSKHWLRIIVGPENFERHRLGIVNLRLYNEDTKNYEELQLSSYDNAVVAQVFDGSYRLKAVSGPKYPEYKNWESELIKVYSAKTINLSDKIDIERDTVKITIKVSEKVLDVLQSKLPLSDGVEKRAVKGEQGKYELILSRWKGDSGDTLTLRIPKTTTTKLYTKTVPVDRDYSFSISDGEILEPEKEVVQEETFTVTFLIGPENYTVLNNAGWDVVNFTSASGKTAIIDYKGKTSDFTAELVKGEKYSFSIEKKSGYTVFYKYPKAIDERFSTVDLRGELFGASDSGLWDSTFSLNGPADQLGFGIYEIKTNKLGVVVPGPVIGAFISSGTIDADSGFVAPIIPEVTDDSGKEIKPIEIPAYSQYPPPPADALATAEVITFPVPKGDTVIVSVPATDTTNAVQEIVVVDEERTIVVLDEEEVVRLSTSAEKYKDFQVGLVNGLGCTNADFICKENKPPHIVYLDIPENQTAINVEITLQDYKAGETVFFSVGEKGKVTQPSTSKANSAQEFIPLTVSPPLTGIELDASSAEIKNGKKFSVDSYNGEKIVLKNWQGETFEFYACQDKTGDGKCDSYYKNGVESTGATFVEPNYEAASITITKFKDVLIEIAVADFRDICISREPLEPVCLSDEEILEEAQKEFCPPQTTVGPDSCVLDEDKKILIIEYFNKKFSLETPEPELLEPIIIEMPDVIIQKGDTIYIINNFSQTIRTERGEVSLEVAKQETERKDIEEKKRQTCIAAMKKAHEEKYATPIKDYSAEYEVNPNLLRAIIYAESSFKEELETPDGKGYSYGLMQINDNPDVEGDIEKYFGEDWKTNGKWQTPANNIEAGLKHFTEFRNQIDARCSSDVLSTPLTASAATATWGEALTVAAYNSGLGDPLYSRVDCDKIVIDDTREIHVPRVIAWARVFAENYDLETTDPDYCKPTITKVVEPVDICITHPTSPECIKPTPESCKKCNTISTCLACVDYKFVSGVFETSE